MAKSSESRAHRWSFFRAGGVDQVLLESGEDIRNLKNLDQKLWVALSCPVTGLEFDEATLRFLDQDNDGRVRAPEILNAVGWLDSVLRSLDVLLEEKDTLDLAHVSDKTAEGKRILGACRQILGGLGKDDARSISLADALETTKVMAAARHNGDGIVPADLIQDADARKVAEEIIACLGGLMDRSGKPGYDQATLEAFFAALEAFAVWNSEAEAAGKTILPLGDKTASAYAALTKVSAKLDDYFARCRLAAFDPRATALLNVEEKEYLAIAAKDLQITSDEIAHFPLAAVVPGQALDLSKGLNPAWEAAMGAFRDQVAQPLLGQDRTAITEADWNALRAKFSPYAAWLAKKAGAAVEGLGIARVRAIVSSGVKAKLAQAVAADLAVADDFAAVGDVERLLRYARHLYRLLNNFVAFADFYARRRPAIFQSGTLFLDGRSCELCVRVGDPGRHGLLAGLAKSYLAYCDLSRPGGERMTVAAAFTAGDSDHLMVGRNGIFYDLKGKDWDATITRIVQNPISVRQAFWAPYKRVLRWVEEQVAKRAAAADEASTAKLVSAAEATGDSVTKGSAAAPRPKFDVGVVAALGVAVGGITAAIGALLHSFFGLGKWMPIGVVGLIFLISGPSMVIAWLKLRQRNLGPILDANGWAVNGRMKVNIPLGGSLTALAALPSGSSRQLSDPFAEKKSPWPRIILFLLVLAALAYGLWRWEAAPKWAAPARDWMRKIIPYSVDDTQEKKPAQPAAPGPEQPK